MNNPPQNQPFPRGQAYVPQRIQKVIFILDRKMFFQQRMVATFGFERMQQIFSFSEPFIFPMVSYHDSFDVYIYVLT